MNGKLVILSALGALAFMLIPARSFADEPSGKYPDRIRTRDEAAQLPIGTRVAIGCKACKTVIDTVADPKGPFLSWYDESKTHKCPNCRGTIAFKGSETAPSRYTHFCTHCGASSAYVCAEHGQHSKD